MPVSARSIVKFKPDLQIPKPLSTAQRNRLTAVAAAADSEIDYSDAPQQRETARWTRPGALVQSENKQQVTLRFEADVLAFFKSTGKRYQCRINTALREYMKAHRKCASERGDALGHRIPARACALLRAVKRGRAQSD